MLLEQEAFVLSIGSRAGLVSLDIPLISNLDVLGNISLIRQYHGDLPQTAVASLVGDLLRRFDFDALVHKRTAVLNERERFVVMLLRATMVLDAIIVIDRPFRLMPNLKDDRFVFSSLKKIDEWYKQCHIFDYIWNEERYGGADAPQEGT